jgi:hypothetical protein
MSSKFNVMHMLKETCNIHQDFEKLCIDNHEVMDDRAVPAMRAIPAPAPMAMPAMAPPPRAFLEAGAGTGIVVAACK